MKDKIRDCDKELISAFIMREAEDFGMDRFGNPKRDGRYY